MSEGLAKRQGTANSSLTFMPLNVSTVALGSPLAAKLATLRQEIALSASPESFFAKIATYSKIIGISMSLAKKRRLTVATNECFYLLKEFLIRLQNLKRTKRPSVMATRALIRVYQLVVSPILGPTCRFEPSCSHYAMTAIERYGVPRGSLLALKRILRCHPWNAGGFDPVP